MLLEDMHLSYLQDISRKGEKIQMVISTLGPCFWKVLAHIILRNS